MSNYRRLFIEGYNYIFFTIVTFNRENILLNNIELLSKSFLYTKEKYDYDIIAITIMKNHIHMILKIKEIKSYPKIIYLLKYYFSRHIVGWEKHQRSHQIIQKMTQSKIKKGEKGIWQRRYWEHTIKNENDLNKHIDYIHYNSMKHYNIAPKNWEYSSFKKFVKLGYYDENWCNIEDKNHINSLNFE